MTATRQAISQKNMWSLEELSLQVEVGGSIRNSEDDGFVIKGLVLEGAEWDNSLILTPNLSAGLPNCIFRWVKD